MRMAIYRPGLVRLPGDLILTVMRAMAIPDLLRAGAVCRTWHAACADARRVQFPITDSSPCLLYTCAADDPDTATVYSVSTGAVFKIRLPPPGLRSRHVVGSSHGWIVTADDALNFQALNPLTGAQVDLPPAVGLDLERFTPHIRQHCRSPGTLRITTYLAYLSCSPAAGSACVVLLVHQEFGDLYFAHVGDDRWASIPLRASLATTVHCNFHGAVHNKKDGNFYVVSDTGCVYALDLNGPSPPLVGPISAGRDHQAPDARIPGALWCDVVLAPWGDILQVWRHKRWCQPTAPVNDPNAYSDDILLAKVDVDDRKQVKMSAADLRGHSLFLGFNASMCLPAKDFLGLKPNCAYLINGSWKQFTLTKFGSREVGIWNFETHTLESLGKVQSDHPWLNWPSPIWITPSLS